MKTSTPMSCLSQREREVLYLIAFEYTNREIGELLFLSSGTVATYRNNILAKLSAKNTAGIVRRAFEKGILICDANSEIELDAPTPAILKILKQPIDTE